MSQYNLLQMIGTHAIDLSQAEATGFAALVGWSKEGDERSVPINSVNQFHKPSTFDDPAKVAKVGYRTHIVVCIFNFFLGGGRGEEREAGGEIVSKTVKNALILSKRKGRDENLHIDRAPEPHVFGCGMVTVASTCAMLPSGLSVHVGIADGGFVGGAVGWAVGGAVGLEVGYEVGHEVG